MAVPEFSVHYLEIVTPDVMAARDLYATSFGWRFGAMDPDLGNAFVAELPDGSLCGIRAPMHPEELPIVRTYVRVPDIRTAVREIARSGARVLLDHMEIPGHGMIAIYEHGGVQQGLWQVT
jgi:predicted enzyme related to lactoylglutathione lyase